MYQKLKPNTTHAMKTKLLSILSFCLVLLLISSSALAQLQRDSRYGFTINIPSNWSKNSYMDGTDKVYDYYSPDENAAVQIRAFDAPAGLTLDLLVSVYEQQMLPAGAIHDGVKNHVSRTGIHGKQGTYRFNYNGTQVGMGVFFAIKNGNGYVVSAMIPTSMLQQKSLEVKSITQSFSLMSSSNSGGSTGGGLSGLTGGTSAKSNFRVTKITLCDQLDYNNRAVNPSTVFGTRTPEIHAVVEYEGYTSKSIVVKWLYGRDRVITEDSYTFSKGQGGVGVVSLSKPNNDWPVGEYWVEFYEGPRVFKELRFNVKQQNTSAGGSGSLAGKYRLLNRSDGQDLVNFHYIFIRDDGFMDEKYQPKDSGNYVGGGKGRWTRSGNTLTLNFDDGTVQQLKISGDKIIRTTYDGVVFTFIKSD